MLTVVFRVMAAPESMKSRLIPLLRKHPRTFSLLFSLLLVLILLVLVEGTFWCLMRGKTTVTYSYSGKHTFHDEALRRQSLIPNQRYTGSAISSQTGEVIYEVPYTIDDFGRRTTPVTRPHLRDRFLLLFGGSFAYGQGVLDNQTLGYYLGDLAPRHRPYNYGFRGWSPAEMLAKLESGPLSNEVAESKGILIYTYIAHHVPRVSGSMRITTWEIPKPYYDLDADGRVVALGEIHEDRPLRTLLYRIMAKSFFLSYFRVDWPPGHSVEGFELTARILAESKRILLEQYPDSRFVVAIYPRGDKAEIEPYLEKHGIDFIDYSTLFSRNDPANRLAPDEGHPGAHAYSLFADALARDLFPPEK